MSRIIGVSFILVFGIIEFGLAQNEIKISVDSIHCQGTKCYLLNFSDDAIFECEFLTLTKTEFEFQHVVDCSGLDEKQVNDLTNNELNIDKIYTINEFEDWVTDLKFSTKYSGRRGMYKEYFQSINNNYGAILKERIDTISRKIIDSRIDIYQIIPIKINNQYYIGGLININDEDVMHLLLPDNQIHGRMYYEGREYKPTNHYFEIDYDLLGNILESYKVRKVNTKKIITSSISKYPLVNREFDEVSIGFPYIIARDNGTVLLYDVLLNDVTPHGLRMAYHNNYFVQLIQNGEVTYLSVDGSITDSMPELVNFIECDNVPCSDKKIVQEGETFMEITSSCNSFEFPEWAESDTLMFTLDEEVISISYLDGESYESFSTDHHHLFFCHDLNQYYFQTKDGNEGIMQLVNEKQERIDRILNDQAISDKEKKETVKHLKNTLKATYRHEVVFKGKFEDFQISGYNRPIVFRENGKVGIFPQMRNGKYKSIEPFIGNLAEIVFDNGEKGWIDLNGKEIRGRIKDSGN